MSLIPEIHLNLCANNIEGKGHRQLKSVSQSPPRQTWSTDIAGSLLRHDDK